MLCSVAAAGCAVLLGVGNRLCRVGTCAGSCAVGMEDGVTWCWCCDSAGRTVGLHGVGGWVCSCCCRSVMHQSLAVAYKLNTQAEGWRGTALQPQQQGTLNRLDTKKRHEARDAECNARREQWSQMVVHTVNEGMQQH